MWKLTRMAAVLGFVLMSTSAGRADEKQGLREVAFELAESVKRAIKTKSVIVGRFSPVEDSDGAGGGFESELAIALGSQVAQNATLVVHGEIKLIRDPQNTALKIVRVSAKITNKETDDGFKEFPEFTGLVRSNTDIGRMTGAITGFQSENQGNASERGKRNKDIQNGRSPGPGQPPAVTAFIHGPNNTLVSTSDKSPYDVEIRTVPLPQFGKAPTTPRSVKLIDGLPFVDPAIGVNEVYEVRIVNRSNQEIAVSLALDGIDEFTFSENTTPILEPICDASGKPVLDGDSKPKLQTALDVHGKPLVRPRFTHWIVAKDGEIVIQGWHKTADPKRSDSVLAFLTTEYGKGAASRFPTKSQGKVGTITVGISYTHPAGFKGGVETGFGPPIKVEQEVVERRIDAPHEFITVRYSR